MKSPQGHPVGHQSLDPVLCAELARAGKFRRRHVRSRKDSIDPLMVAREPRVHAILHLPRAAFAPGHHTHEYGAIGTAKHQWSTAVPLAGIYTAVVKARAHHTGQYTSIVRVRLVAGGRVDKRDCRFLEL